MFLLLHRFTRLMTSDKVEIEAIGQFLNNFIALTKNFKKARQFDVWAEVLCTICSQLKGDYVESIEKPVTQIFNIAMDKLRDQHSDESYLVLIGILLQRFSSLKKKYYNEYLNKSILEKVNKPQRTYGCLKAFLYLIRGAYVSKSSAFWEWGKVNAQVHYGVEATQIADPSQDQSDPNSYTSLFFKYFIPIPKIEQYFEIIGEILLNFAARDFSYFIKETAPLLINSMPNDRCLLPLSECLVRIVDKDLHFEDWSQLNIRNNSVNVSSLIPNLFNMIKDFLFKITNSTLKKSPPTSLFNFTMKNHVDNLEFHLPLHFNGQSSSMSERINKANDFVNQRYDFRLNKHSSSVFEEGSIDKITEDESIHIKLLSFFPRILNNSDLTTIGRTIINLCATKSKSVSLYAIKVINSLYVTNPEFRLTIFDILLDSIDQTNDEMEMSIFIMILAKLMDLSMRPSCVTHNSLVNFVNHAMATILSCLCNRCCCLRDLAMNLSDRVKRFARSFKINMPLRDIVYDKNITRNSMKIPKGDASLEPRYFASTEYWDIFSILIPPMISKFSMLGDEECLSYLFKITDKKLDMLGEEQLSDSLLAKNYLAILTNCISATEKQSYKKISNFIDVEKFESKSSLTKHHKALFNRLENYMRMMGEKKVKKNGLVESIFDNLNWQTISYIWGSIDRFKIFNDADFMLSFSNIIIKLLSSKDIQYAMICCENAMLSFDKITKVFKEYFISLGVNSEKLNDEPLNIEGKMNDKILDTAKNFLTIINLWVSSFIYPLKCYDGPILMPKVPSFIYSDGFNLICTNLAIFCHNWTNTKSDEINNLANSSIASLSCINPVFTVSFPMSPKITSILFLSAHSGKDTLKRCLFFHYKTLIKEYTKAVYEKSQEVSRIYFLAICSFFCGDAPKNERRAQMVQRMQSPLEKPESRMNDRLTYNEKSLQIDIVQTAGNVIVCAMLNILHVKEEIRMASFKLIMRILPLVNTLLNEGKDVSQDIYKHLDAYADAIYTNSTTLGPKHIIKIASLISEWVPYISESVVEECLRAAKISSTISQNAFFDIMSVFLKNICWSEGGYIKKKTHKLQICTPISLAKALIEVFSSVNHSSLHSYLNGWKKLSSELELIISYLLDIKEESLIPAAKTVLVYMAKSNTDAVIGRLINELTFTNWFYMNMQGKLESNYPPSITPNITIQIVLQSLSEICQNSVEHIFPHIHIICNFSILFYDTYPQVLELLYVIFSILQDTSSILEIILDTTKIESVEFFTDILVKYFYTQKAKSVVHRWGNECIKWATGCGSFEIASRAAAVYSKILIPFDNQIISIMLKSLYSVSTAQQNQMSIKYITNIFVVLNKLVDKMMDSQAFSEHFTHIMKVSEQFMNVPDDNISIEATRIVAKYVASTKCNYDEMLQLLPPICSLLCRTENKRSVDALLMSMIITPKTSARHHRPHLSNIAFCLFLPRLISAFGAYHNMEPFVVLSDAEVKHVLECGLCFSRLPYFEIDITYALHECILHPSEHMFDEFAFRICKPMLANEASKFVGPYFTAMTQKSNEVLKCATFVVVSSMLRGCTSKSDVRGFLEMMPIAANHAISSTNSKYSSELLDIFVVLSKTQPINQVPIASSKIVIPESSWRPTTSIPFVHDDQLPPLTSGNDAFQSPISIVPIDKLFWNDAEIHKFRQKLAKIVVQPQTELHENLEMRKAEVPDKEKIIQVPNNVDDFIKKENIQEEEHSEPSESKEPSGEIRGRKHKKEKVPLGTSESEEVYKL
ncbi:FURRY-related family [Trichomonas vaginalis G3]|uniref:FURRY-related family n=1 Tax=Trichomonas vaginalis (strain ATCC PRA-98 / G3) TaxID=412133 RepID=UPI0021E5A689|nr:FURRY-related family [Trichomonas vaginalis G3]KAI5496681.1 FURRY-related family [Trichomonas vaginalis G3]